MTDSESESDIEMKSALLKKKPKIPTSPSDDVILNLKKTTMKMMITDALTELKSRKGVSLYAIKKHLKEKYQVNTEKLNFLVKKSLKTGVEDGTFVQMKGVGASGSFKLAITKEKVKKPKKKEEKGAKETKKEKVVKPKKTMEKSAETKPEVAKKKKSEEVKPSKKKTDVKATKKTKEKDNKEEKSKADEQIRKKSKTKMAKGMQTPAKKREAILKRKSIGSIIRRPKMKPKHN